MSAASAGSGEPPSRCRSRSYEAGRHRIVPLLKITLVINMGAPPMTTTDDTRNVCCVALELSKTSWVCAFAVPGDGKTIVHKIKARDVDRLFGIPRQQ